MASNLLLQHTVKYPNLKEIIEERIQQEINLNIINTLLVDKSPLLVFAIDNDDIKLAKFLLNYGANINIKSPFRWPPLHIAQLYNKIMLMIMLLEYDANTNIKNQDGKNALDIRVSEEVKKEFTKKVDSIKLLNIKV